MFTARHGGGLLVAALLIALIAEASIASGSACAARGERRSRQPRPWLHRWGSGSPTEPCSPFRYPSRRAIRNWTCGASSRNRRTIRSSASRRTQRGDRADRRHGLRSAERVRRHDPDADARLGSANAGLRFNRFHTTALCSPTRMAILTGRNHHNVNTGAIMELATGFHRQHGDPPALHARSPRSCGRTATARQRSASGTNRRPGKSSVSGPFDRWPTHSGFDKFYGFMGGETNQ